MALMRTLTVYLLKPFVKSPEDALKVERPQAARAKRQSRKPPRQIIPIDLRDGLGFPGKVFFTKNQRHAPGWKAFLEEGLASTAPDLSSRNASALLVVKAKGRHFAITFGPAGRFLLADGVAEEKFGLRVVLNAVNPTKIRSIDMKNIESITRNKRTQTSRSTSLDHFGLDIQQDLVRAVHGIPKDLTLADVMGGRDSLFVHLPLDINDLAKKLGRFLEVSREETYKETFPFVDNMQDVEDRDLISQLDELLVDYFREGDTSKAHLAPPDIVDWDDIEGFQYWYDSAGTPLRKDLDIEEYLEPFQDITLYHLRDCHLNLISHAGEIARGRWTIYQCLVAEVQHEGQTYILESGKWWRVASTFAEQVNEYVAALPAASLMFPQAGAGEHEGLYNQRVRDGAPDQMFLLDKELIAFEGYGRIEGCDIFTMERQLVHVKRAKGGSSSLSHLFAQGSVSAQGFSMDPVYRSAFRDKLEVPFNTLVPDGPLPWMAFEVVFAIITSSPKPLHEALPFFSRMNLMTHAGRLQRLGFKVSLAKISTHVTPVPGQVVVPVQANQPASSKVSAKKAKSKKTAAR